MGYAYTIPADVTAEMSALVRTGEYDVKRLRLALCHRLGTWVPYQLAEFLHETYLEGDV